MLIEPKIDPLAVYTDGSRPLTSAWDMGNQTLTNVNVDSGTIDGATIGGSTPAAVTGTTLALTNASRARAYRTTSNQSVSSASWVKVQLNVEDYDTRNEFDSATNYRFIADAAGYYQVDAASTILSLGDGKIFGIAIYKNGSAVAVGRELTGSANNAVANISTSIYLTAGEYLELYVYQNSGSSANIVTGSQYTYMSIHRLS